MIKRFIFNRLRTELSQPEINILLGPRQVGKTTLLKHLHTFAIQSGRKAAFFDLEQPQVLAEFNAPPRQLVGRLKAAGEVVFIDEFQYLPNASRILKAVYDSGAKVKFVCSGSSSLEIHKHLKESLAGRRFLYRIYPLQFSELRAAQPIDLTTYLRYGGMPALTHTDSDEKKRQILTEILSAYILKDVKSLIREENIRAFNHLLYLLAENQGSLVSVHSLANQLSLSVKATNRYLDLLEETFVNFRVSSFSSNLGNELKKSTKTYLYDLGIRNALLKDFSAPAERADKGILLESFVFLKLRSALAPNMEVKFWRTKQGEEVDFILLKDRKPIPIEVKGKLAGSELPKGLLRFLARYPSTKMAYVVNESQQGMLQHGACSVRFLTPEQFDSGPDLAF